MKYCPKCQRKVGGMAAFCPQCGAELQEIPKNIGNETSTKKRNAQWVWILLTFVFAVWGIVMSMLFVSAKEEIEIYERWSYEIIDERNRLQDQVDFMDETIALVLDDGTEYYHTFECYKEYGGRFLAFNITAAENNGYTPCPDCH